ncbi:hypothetical protein ACKWTF_010222 [Chironomus riparius]
MHLRFLSIIFLHLNHLTCFSIDSSSNFQLLSQGLKIIADEIIAEKTINFNMVYVDYHKDSNSFRDSFMKLLMTDSKFRVRQQLIDHVKQLATKTPRRFALIAIRNYLDFKKLHMKLNQDNFDYQGHYILALINGKIYEIQQIFDDLWKLQIHNVIMIFDDFHRHLQVLTFFPFRSSYDCSNTTPIVINEFINGTFVQNLSSIYQQSMKNLQQCEVKVATSSNMPPNMFLKTLYDKKQFFGRDYELISTLSQSLNFRLNFSFLSDFGCLFEVNGREGVMKNLLNNKSDMAIVDCWLKIDRLKMFDASTTYFTEKIVMAFPMEVGLSSFEKLFYPLGNDTWLLLLIFLSIGVTFIFVIRFSSQRIQYFVIGENVRHPYFNMFIGIIGQNHEQVPVNNFARFLLMNFILFTLVIRTAYQGKLFEIMQLDIKYSEPQTIMEMTEKGYKFHVLDIFSELILDRSKFRIIDDTGSRFDYIT